MATGNKNKARASARVTVSANSVLIGCKLPHGLIIEHGDKTVTLAGKNSSMIIGGEFGITEVDADFWAAWKETHAEFPALKNCAIFEANDADTLDAVASELSGEKTGFEGMAQDSNGITTANDD